ncbi:MAG: PAS domain-containing protein [Pseudolabrys sp.]|nr:PAS domain-containing protein [Pseudolabrys sp.]
MELQVVAERKAPLVLDQEVPFKFEELFFSRTNPRGVINFGNGVFQRISLYSWDELFKKPHNVIRHPDMPRGVFWLLWDTLKKGEPIGAYVKNRAKDGRHYWVYAIVTPIESGYLSVRLKPSALLSVVTDEYKALLSMEVKDKLEPKASAALLLKRLAQLGFEDYGSFMAAALSQEMAARNQQLRREPDRMIACYDQLNVAAKALLNQAEAIFNAYASSKYVPLNLTIQAAQLGAGGATIGVISDNYSLISSEIKDNLTKFIASAQQVLKSINSGQFLLCTAKVQHEVVDFFRTETSSDQHDKEQEMSFLEQQEKEYQLKAVESLRTITQQAERFEQDCDDMKMLTSGLEVTRVMGQMESSRLTGVKDGLDELMEDLKVFQVAVTNSLKEIGTLNRNIQQNARQLMKFMKT